METKFQTSFIPKKPETDNKTMRSHMGILLFISIIIFLISLGIGAFVFLQKQYLIKTIATDQDNIAKNQGSFDTPTIDSIVELNGRIEVAKGLLASHTSISPVFNFLNQATLKNVRFKDFSFSGSTLDSNGQKTVGIKMNGVAKDFETVASQADEFGDQVWRNIIRGTKVSNLSLNSDGSVSFVLSATVVPDILLYKNAQNNSGVTQ